MTANKIMRVAQIAQWLLFAALPAAAPAFADVGARVQFCWALGKFDDTVYFAEAEGSEDRQASFVTLMDISGIDHNPVECRVLDSKSYHLMRTGLMKSWTDSEFEIVNTTFLSDLDY